MPSLTLWFLFQNIIRPYVETINKKVQEKKQKNTNFQTYFLFFWLQAVGLWNEAQASLFFFCFFYVHLQLLFFPSLLKMCSLVFKFCPLLLQQMNTRQDKKWITSSEFQCCDSRHIYNCCWEDEKRSISTVGYSSFISLSVKSKRI